jgi:hypothetical protein
MNQSGAVYCGSRRSSSLTHRGLRTSVLVVVVLACGLSWSLNAASRPLGSSRIGCGRESWVLKTLSDPQRKLVNLHPRNTTVRAINRRRMPSPTPARRTTRFQRHVWRVLAQVVEYKLEQDDDIHIVLFEHGAYMIAEMPSAACLPPTARDRRAITSARRLFESRCGLAIEMWRPLGAVAYISGVGFWDFPHGQSGHARNYAELHPVTSIRIVAGCN